MTTAMEDCSAGRSLERLWGIVFLLCLGGLSGYGLYEQFYNKHDIGAAPLLASVTGLSVSLLGIAHQFRKD